MARGAGGRRPERPTPLGNPAAGGALLTDYRGPRPLPSGTSGLTQDTPAHGKTCRLAGQSGGTGASVP